MWDYFQILFQFVSTIFSLIKWQRLSWGFIVCTFRNLILYLTGYNINECCMKWLAELFLNCFSSDLEELNASHCQLRSVKALSQYFPSLQILSISNNLIASKDDLVCIWVFSFFSLMFWYNLSTLVEARWVKCSLKGKMTMLFWKFFKFVIYLK